MRKDVGLNDVTDVGRAPQVDRWPVRIQKGIEADIDVTPGGATAIPSRVHVERLLAMVNALGAIASFQHEVPVGAVSGQSSPVASAGVPVGIKDVAFDQRMGAGALDY